MQSIEIEANGFTSILTASGKINQHEWNKIKIVLADVAGVILISYMLLSAKSFSCVNKSLIHHKPHLCHSHRQSV
jgi:hypothetical protein